MSTLTTHTLLLLSLAGFFAGYIDSIAGGGGMVNLPALLLAGIPPHDVLGTNKLAGMCGTINSSRIYFQKELLNPKPWWPGLLATFFGGILGVLATHLFSSQHLRAFLPWMILAVAFYFLSPFSISKHEVTPTFSKKDRQWSIAVGLLMGCYDGFFGPGTGAFLTLFGAVLFALPMIQSMAMARFFNLSGNISATLTFMLLGNVNYKVGICMALANVLGAQAGAHSAIRFGAKFVRVLFILIVIGMTIRLICV